MSKETHPRHNTQTLIGRRVRDSYAGTGDGTITGRNGRYYRVEWDNPSPNPSYIDLTQPFWELLSSDITMPTP